MLYALLLTSCALMTAQPSAAPTKNTDGVAVVETSTVTVQPNATAPTQIISPTAYVSSAVPTSAPMYAVAQQVPTVTPPTVSVATAPLTLPTATVSTGTGSGDDSMDRVERRRQKQMRFAAGIDSLVMSHSFRFLPNSMQELPGGWTQLIYNELYFVGVFKDHVEVHMPTVRGNVVQYIEILNFDTFQVKNYQVSRTQFGWSVSFNMISGDDTNIAVSLMVYNLTGEAVLNLLTLSNTVRYVGYIQSLTKN